MRLGVHSCFDFRYLIHGNRAIQSKASLRGYNAFFRPDFPQEPSLLVFSNACLPALPAFWSRLTGPYSRHGLWGATIPNTLQSGPQQGGIHSGGWGVGNQDNSLWTTIQKKIQKKVLGLRHLLSVPSINVSYCYFFTALFIALTPEFSFSIFSFLI